MYHITERATGDTVATVQFDPYRFDMKKSDKVGVRRILSSMEDREQMNRTAGGEADDDSSTSLERNQEPSDEFILDRIAAVLNEGYAVVEAEDEGE